jgi:hypothetical protein
VELACKASAEVHESLPHSATLASVYAFALASAGRATEARSLLRSIENSSDFLSNFSAIASRAWSVLGDKQEAIRELATCARNRDYWLGMMLNHPANAGLRVEPGFQDVYRTVFGSDAENWGR